MANQGGVTNDILKAVGREQGPDYMLKLLPEHDVPQNITGLTYIDDAAGNKAINMTSSITEVLNVVSYLCSTTRDGTLIDTNNSVRGPPGINIGQHEDGVYSANAANTAINNSFMNAKQGVAGSEPLFNINTLLPVVDAGGNAVIPVGILRRTEPAQPAAAVSWIVKAVAPQVDTYDRVKPIMSDCIKQMINILVKTREIFGPKGWTDLFQKVKGGGSSRSKNAKRTHRHRRRYSSKQY